MCLESDRNDFSSNEALKPETITHNVYSVFPAFAMLAGLELDVFTPLQNGPLNAQELAQALGVREDKLQPLLYLLVVGGLLEVNQEKFSNTVESARYLVGGQPDYIGGLSGFYKMIWEVSLKTAESIRTGKPQAKVDFHSLPDEELMMFFRKQDHSSRRAGKEIAEKFDFAPYENLLDAGGGTGGVSMAVCSQYPGLKATVAELPKVAKIAEHFIAENNLADRIKVTATDLCVHAPAGIYDAAIVRAVVQTLSMEKSRATLNNVGRAMTSGGRIFIFGNVLENSRLGPEPPVANNLAFLNLYDFGGAYTENEFQDMLTGAGFKEVKVVHNALDDGMGLITALKS